MPYMKELEQRKPSWLCIPESIAGQKDVALGGAGSPRRAYVGTSRTR